jgi:hypothetical protein
MTKRLVKRHKREVARAKQRVKLSEPDLRTPEQVKAARDASRPAAGRLKGPAAHYSNPSIRNRAGTAANSPAKADA